MSKNLPPTYRQIEPELYKDYYLLGIRDRDLPYVVGGFIVLIAVPNWFGFKIWWSLILPAVWLLSSVPFLQWARWRRRPYWLEHWWACVRRGRVQERVLPKSEKYKSSYLID